MFRPEITKSSVVIQFKHKKSNYETRTQANNLTLRKVNRRFDGHNRAIVDYLGRIPLRNMYSQDKPIPSNNKWAHHFRQSTEKI